MPTLPASSPKSPTARAKPLQSRGAAAVETRQPVHQKCLVLKMQMQTHVFPAPLSPLGDHAAPCDGGSPAHAPRLAAAARLPTTRALRSRAAASLPPSLPSLGRTKHQHKHFSTAGVQEVVAGCSGKGRDQESRSDKPLWGHQSSPKHFVTARQHLRGPGKGPGQVGSALPCCSHIPRDALPAS